MQGDDVEDDKVEEEVEIMLRKMRWRMMMLRKMRWRMMMLRTMMSRGR